MEAPSVLVAGETLVDCFPTGGESLAEASAFARRPGGAPANVAVGLARLDEPPLYWTRLGGDPFGDYLATVLADAAVPVRFVVRDADRKTPLAFVGGRPSEREGDLVNEVDGGHANEREGDSADFVGGRADPEFAFYREGTTMDAMEPGRVPDGALADLDWVHVGGVPLSAEPSRTALLDLIARAGDADCTVSFDPNVRPDLWPDDATMRDATWAAVSNVDVVAASREDLAALGVTDTDAERAAAVCERGPHTAFVTRGAAGAYAHATADAPWRSAAASHAGVTVDAVDPTGAGDAFTAGVVAALRRGADLDATLSFACEVGAAATTAVGAMAALPRAADIGEVPGGRNPRS